MITSGRDFGYVDEKALEIAHELETELSKLSESFGLLAVGVEAIPMPGGTRSFSVNVVAQKQYPKDAASLIVETVCQSVEKKYCTSASQGFGFLIKVTNGVLCSKVVDTEKK